MTRRADSGPALRALWLAAVAAGHVSERLAAPAASALWFTPWRVPVGDRERIRRAGWLSSTEPVSVPAAGIDLAGFAAGEGPTVLLVHGWGEQAASLGAFIGPLVAAGHRVVGVDLPGHGESGNGGTDLYSLARALREVAGSLEARAVVAHSMGAAETVMALRDGLELDAVALLAPAVRLEHAFAQFVRTFRLPPKASAALARVIERRFGAGVWEEAAADRAARDLGVPALVVHDRDDPQIAHSDAELLAAAWPGARLVLTEGLGHSRLLRDADVVSQVRAFLTDAPIPSEAASRGAIDRAVAT